MFQCFSFQNEENMKSKNRGASDLTKAKYVTNNLLLRSISTEVFGIIVTLYLARNHFDTIEPGEAFETIRGQINANPNEVATVTYTIYKTVQMYIMPSISVIANMYYLSFKTDYMMYGNQKTFTTWI